MRLLVNIIDIASLKWTFKMHKAIRIVSGFILSISPAILNAAPSFAGTYIGADVGSAWASSSYHTNPNCPPSTFSVFCDSTAGSIVNGTAVGNSGTGQLNLTRANLDAHVGHNWVVRNFIIGAEAEFGSLNLSKTVIANGIFPFPFLGNAYTVNNSISTSWLGTLRLRVGTVIKEHYLIYAAGGLAFTDFKLSSGYNDNAVGFGFPGGSGYNSKSRISSGWTLGAGGEWQFADNYSAEIEYLYVKFNQLNLNVPLSNTPAYTQTMKVNADLSTQIARIGFNYKFS